MKLQSEFYGVPLSDELLERCYFSFLFTEQMDPDYFESEIDALIECLLEEGIIVDREPLPDSISDNPITTQSNNPITTTIKQSNTTINDHTLNQAINRATQSSNNYLNQTMQ